MLTETTLIVLPRGPFLACPEKAFLFIKISAGGTDAYDH